MMQWVVEEVSVVKFNNINTAFGRVTRFRWWEAKSGQWHTPVNNQQQQRLRQPAETTTNEKKHPGKKTLKSRNAAPVGITFLDYVTWDRLNWHWVFHPLGGPPRSEELAGQEFACSFLLLPWKMMTLKRQGSKYFDLLERSLKVPQKPSAKAASVFWYTMVEQTKNNRNYHPQFLQVQFIVMPTFILKKAIIPSSIESSPYNLWLSWDHTARESVEQLRVPFLLLL